MRKTEKLKNNKKLRCTKYIFLVLIIQTLLFCISSVSIAQCTEDTGTSTKLELFTQKTLNVEEDPEQANKPFDALETVEIYAKVLYGEEPQANILVSFEIRGPENSSFEYLFFRTTKTNEEGVASISFSIPPANSTNTSTGTWNVYSAAEILGERTHDTLSFEVEVTAQLLGVRELFILLLVTTAVSTATPLGIFLRKTRQKESQAVLQQPIVQDINENEGYTSVPLAGSVIDTIENLEKEKAELFAEVSQLRKVAENKAVTLTKEIEELKKEAERLRKFKSNS
jgi:hypothetical protein